MLYALLFIAAIASDQWLKYWVVNHLAVGESMPFIPHILQLERLHNYGAAWSSLTGKTALLVAMTSVMLIGIAELISERVQKLDWVLPKARLYRGFGALTLGGAMGMLISAAGLLCEKVSALVWFMLAGSALCALFAWLLFREYKPQDRAERSETHGHS